MVSPELGCTPLKRGIPYPLAGKGKGEGVWPYMVLLVRPVMVNTYYYFVSVIIIINVRGYNTRYCTGCD